MLTRRVDHPLFPSDGSDFVLSRCAEMMLINVPKAMDQSLRPSVPRGPLPHFARDASRAETETSGTFTIDARRETAAMKLMLKLAVVLVPVFVTFTAMFLGPGCAMGNPLDDDPTHPADASGGKLEYTGTDFAQGLPETTPSYVVDSPALSDASRNSDGAAGVPDAFVTPPDASLGDAAEASPAPDTGTLDSGVDTGTCTRTVSVLYIGPVIPGFTVINAWWQPPGLAPRAWGKISECADLFSGDGVLDCAFNVPCGTTSLEFQIDLPDGRFWGDKSFWPTGGKGATIGTVWLKTPKGPLTYTMIPNPKGGPYFNGFVAAVL